MRLLYAPHPPILPSFREKELEQLEHLEQLAKIKGLRCSTAMEHGAADLEQQRCFAPCANYCAPPLRLILHLVQKRWNEDDPEHALPGTALRWWPSAIASFGDRYLFLFPSVPHVLIEPQLLRTFPA